jgi:hypothetical protein
MKTSVLLSFSVLLTSCFSASGQVEEGRPVKTISVNEFYILPAFLRLQQTFATSNEFKALAPQSILLNRDVTGLSSSSNFFYGQNGSLSILLGVKFANKNKTAYRKSPSLRIGITCMSASLLTGGLYQQTKGGADTLVSAQSGKSIYIDSLISERYDMEYKAQQLRLDCSLIFRTDPDARCALYSGIGITAGYSINSTTTISYNQSKWIRYGTDDESGYQNSGFFFPTRHTADYKSQSEKFRNQNSFSTSAYVPIGIDFRIGKRRAFWKMTHVFYEMRLGVNFSFVSVLHTFASTSMQHGLGLKVAW